MTGAASARGWMVPVIALFLSAFSICTAEFIIAGLLPAIASDLKVDIPTAGLLISGYALGVAVASPLFALATGSIPRRPLLIALMLIFVAGNMLCAVSTTYWMLLGARLLVAGSHGLFFGIALIIAMRLAPEGRQSSAVSLVVAGVSLASVLGVPIGTAIGNAYGWRMTFWVIAVAGVLAAVAVAILIKDPPGQRGEGSNLGAELRAAMRPPVLLSYAAIAVFMIGLISLYSYIVPLLTTVSGVPIEYVPLVLFGMGFAGVFGNLVAGRLADRNPFVTLIVILSATTVIFLVMATLTSNAWGTSICFCAGWLIGFGFPAPIQTRLLRYVADAPNFASTLISSAFNIGIAIGAAVITAGWGYSTLPLILAAGHAVTLLLVIALALHERGRAVQAIA